MIAAGCTPPSRVTGVFGNGRKQWVRMSPGTHAGEHLGKGRRWHVDVHHHGEADPLRDLAGNIEGHEFGIAGCIEADTHFDSDEAVAMGLGDLYRIVRSQSLEITALAHHDAL